MNGKERRKVCQNTFEIVKVVSECVWITRFRPLRPFFNFKKEIKLKYLKLSRIK